MVKAYTSGQKSWFVPSFQVSMMDDENRFVVSVIWIVKPLAWRERIMFQYFVIIRIKSVINVTYVVQFLHDPDLYVKDRNRKNIQEFYFNKGKTTQKTRYLKCFFSITRTCSSWAAVRIYMTGGTAFTTNLKVGKVVARYRLSINFTQCWDASRISDISQEVLKQLLI